MSTCSYRHAWILHHQEEIETIALVRLEVQFSPFGEVEETAFRFEHQSNLKGRYVDFQSEWEMDIWDDLRRVSLKILLYHRIGR